MAAFDSPLVVQFNRPMTDKPFFLYLPHNMVHIPVHASADFIGKSKFGIYGDAIQELDWSTGEILKTLRELALEENTLVIFASDNGPHLGQGGNAGPLRGAKGSTFEGGVRVPCVMRWPGKIPGSRVTDEPVAIMDLLPTIVTLASGTVPTDRVIDGKDIWPVIANVDEAKSPHEAIYYLSGRSLDGIRMGDWKYVTAPAKDVPPEVAIELTPDERKLPRRQRNALVKERTKAAQGKQGDIEMLFNLREDLGEAKDLIDQHPEIAARLKSRLKTFESEFRKTLRPAGTAE